MKIQLLKKLNIVRGYYEQFNTNSFENIDKTDKFLGKYVMEVNERRNRELSLSSKQ